MRGGKKDRGLCSCSNFNPLALRALPLYSLQEHRGVVEMYSSFAFAPILYRIPRHATGHGKGGGEYPTKLRRDKTVQCDTFNPLPLLIADE